MQSHLVLVGHATRGAEGAAGFEALAGRLPRRFADRTVAGGCTGSSPAPLTGPACGHGHGHGH